jgi:hypothetical protein
MAAGLSIRSARRVEAFWIDCTGLAVNGLVIGFRDGAILAAWAWKMSAIASSVGELNTLAAARSRPSFE